MWRRPDYVSQNLGIIVRLARRYWRRLPRHVVAFFDLEDMIAEVTMQVVAASTKYRRRRGMHSTFVHHVAENHCRLILLRYSLKKRQATAVICYEDLKGVICLDRGVRFSESRQAVERLIADASDPLRRAFASFLLHGRYYPWRPALLEEARRLAARHRVSYDDLRLVLPIM